MNMNFHCLALPVSSARWSAQADSPTFIHGLFIALKFSTFCASLQRRNIDFVAEV